MGISTSAIIEHGGNGRWIGFGEFDFDKNNTIKHILGQSEYGTYPLRGRPADLSSLAIHRLSSEVKDTHPQDDVNHDYVLRSTAEHAVKIGHAEWIGEKQERICYHVDNISWITRDELANLLPHFAEDWVMLELMTTILDKMNTLAPLGNSRLIYWFS
jgi:hypothetical protein